MGPVIFYLIVKPLSLLPLGFIYRVSDLIYLVMRCGLAYRRKIVTENLKKSFPKETNARIQEIQWKFYRHFCDLVAESIKLFSISEKEAIRRFKVTNPELINQLGKSAILVGGHYTNWELFAVATAPQIEAKLLGIYTPLTNPFLEKVFSRTRTRFGLTLTPKNEVKNHLKKYQGQSTLMTFAIDQSPRAHQKVHWTTFLSQQTAVSYGAEKYAKEFNYPVVFGVGRKVKRGHYELTFEVIASQPTQASQGGIIERATQKLEKQILEAPEYWLWSHKRWKMKKG